MRSIIDFALEDIVLTRRKILRSQGVPDEVAVSGNVERIFEEADQLFRELVEPRGIIADIDIPAFEEVLQGEGLNEKENPVEEIFRESDGLALFAVTLGQVLSGRVTELFDDGGYAVGYMLDSISSCAADRLAELAAEVLQSEPAEREPSAGSLRVLAYSPGYCGWHISGQKKLFEVLRPEEIGITLNESFLMSPIKTVSGVLIGGSWKIHEFENSYPFCDACATRSCIGRMRSSRQDRSPVSEG
jgi:hypothetical protein